ncbi:hypothetical protein ACFL1R_07260 [Candidatus Latescibacterota bacterium]
MKTVAPKPLSIAAGAVAGTAFLMSFFQGFLMLAFFKMGTTPLMLGIYASAIGFNFGGNFALFSTATVMLLEQRMSVQITRLYLLHTLLAVLFVSIPVHSLWHSNLPV